jgi:transcription termination/antitermination protein NusG
LVVNETESGSGQWFAIWTQSHCEQLVHDQLLGKGMRPFLPTIRTWSRRAGVRRLIPVPMFPSYLFIRCEMDKDRYIEVLKSRGVVRLLGERWDRLTPIPDAEMESVQRIANTDIAVMPHPYLREGQRVRIGVGPLTGLEGILLRTKPNRGLLVLSVDLLQQGVAVEVDCTAVTPVGSSTCARFVMSSC